MKYSDRILKMALEESIYHMIMESKVTDKCIDDFGKELFGDFLNKKEKDTDIEARYFEKIWDFVADNDKHPKLKSALIHLKKCTKDYPEILKPDSNVLYRGTVGREDLIKKHYIKSLKEVEAFLKMPKKKIGDNTYVLLEKSYSYKPRHEIQSWSTKIYKAEEFTPGGKSSDSDEWDAPKVVYQATSSDKDLIFSTKFMNKIAKKALGDTEYEIIRIGGPINVQVWLCITRNFVGNFVDTSVVESMESACDALERDEMDIWDVMIDFLVKSGYNRKELKDVFKDGTLISAGLRKDFKTMERFLGVLFK
jgi:hypothetical protein